MFPNAVEPSARMNMGAVKRFWNRVNPVYAATLSTTDTYLVSPAVAIGGYGLHERWRVRFPSPNSATSPTVNISSVGPQLLRKYNGDGSIVNLAKGDVQAQDHGFWWDGTQLILENPTAVTGASLVLIGVFTGSGAASIACPNIFSSTYDYYQIVFGLEPATDGGTLVMRVTQDGGSTYKSTGYSSGLGFTASTGTRKYDVRFGRSVADCDERPVG